MEIQCTTPDELSTAIKNKAEFITIEGDLRNKVIKIKATGKVAWGVCAASLTAAIAFYVATPTATIVATPVAGAATSVSGLVATTAAVAAIGPAAVTAIAIGVAAGGIGVLNTLRDKYKIVEKGKKHIKLQRK